MENQSIIPPATRQEPPLRLSRQNQSDFYSPQESPYAQSRLVQYDSGIENNNFDENNNNQSVSQS